MPGDEQNFDLDFDARAGDLRRVSRRTRRLVAPNAGPFTFTGTCSYIVGSGDVAIVDPGPAIASHVEKLLAAIAGERLTAILVTHTHKDHSPAAMELREITGAPVLGCAAYAAPPDIDVTGPGLDASHDRDYAPDRALRDAETIPLGGATLEALATPGHTANHLCFALREERTLFTGDHVMGWATSVIAPPDGKMRDYMASIEKLRTRDDVLFWPGHGGPVAEPQQFLRALVAHRRQREAAILQRLAMGDETIPKIVETVYDNLDRRLHGAAALTVFAHLEDLVARGVVAASGAPSIAARYVKI